MQTLAALLLLGSGLASAQRRDSANFVTPSTPPSYRQQQRELMRQQRQQQWVQPQRTMTPTILPGQAIPPGTIYTPGGSPPPVFYFSGGGPQAAPAEEPAGVNPPSYSYPPPAAPSQSGESEARQTHVAVYTGPRHPPEFVDLSEVFTERVKNYVAAQGQHHRKEDFKSELLRLLRAHEVEFDERYVFD